MSKKIDLNCYVFLPLSKNKLLLIFFFCAFLPSFISNTSIFSINFRANLDDQNSGKWHFWASNFEYFLWRMPDPQLMHGLSVTNVAFSHCYLPLIYYLTKRSLFKQFPHTLHGEILKKDPALSG